MDEAGDVVFPAHDHRTVHGAGGVADAQLPLFDELGEPEPERVRGGREVGGRLLDREQDGLLPRAREVGRGLQGEDRLARAALADDERGAPLRDASVRDDVQARHRRLDLLDHGIGSIPHM
jgi:hypothetical protein